MKLGDFSDLAKNYINRPAYSETFLDVMQSHLMKNFGEKIQVADFGAGTGKFTKMLAEKGFRVSAVEPNDEMRKEGITYTKGLNVEWSKGSGESDTLPADSFEWLTMASSFHWTDPKVSLPNFHKKLKKNGLLTILWNPRDIESSPLHQDIENSIYEVVPTLNRVSSGNAKHTNNWTTILQSTGHFKDVFFIEVQHVEIMSKERYLGAWNSVNDIRAQAGEEGWKKIIQNIERKIQNLNQIEVPYKTRAWTARRSH